MKTSSDRVAAGSVAKSNVPATSELTPEHQLGAAVSGSNPLPSGKKKFDRNVVHPQGPGGGGQGGGGDPPFGGDEGDRRRWTARGLQAAALWPKAASNLTEQGGPWQDQVIDDYLATIRSQDVMSKNGHKAIFEDIVDYKRTSDGSIVYLQTGVHNPKTGTGTGLMHILGKRPQDLLARVDKIQEHLALSGPDLVKEIMDIASTGGPICYSERKRHYPEHNAELTVVVSENGFIVTAFSDKT